MKDFILGMNYDVICVSLIILILRLDWCLRNRSRGRWCRCGCGCGRSLLLFLFLLKTFKCLIDHLFSESLPAEEDALLGVRDFLQIFTTEEDGGYGDQLFVLL